MKKPDTLAAAAALYLDTLSAEQVDFVKSHGPNYQLQPHREIIDDIIEFFNLNDENKKLSDDIEKKCEDDKLFEPVFWANRPLFEGTMIHQYIFRKLHEEDGQV